MPSRAQTTLASPGRARRTPTIAREERQIPFPTGLLLALAVLLVLFLPQAGGGQADADIYRDINVRDISSPEGVDLTLAQIAQGRPLLACLWSPDSPLCDQEAELVSDFRRQLAGQGIHAIMVVSIPPAMGGQAGKQAAWDFISSRSITLPAYLDYGGKLKRGLAAQVGAVTDLTERVPAAVLFSPAGAVQVWRIGATPKMLTMLGRILPGVGGRETEHRLAEPIGIPTDCLGHRYRRHIARVLAAGVMTTYADGSFRPDQPISETHFMEAISRATGQAEGSSPQQGTTQPDISRMRALVVVVRTLAPLGEGSRGSQVRLADFTDAASIPEWASQTYQEAYALGLLDTGPRAALEPARPATRGEAAFWLSRLSRPRPEHPSGLLIAASGYLLRRSGTTAIYDPQGRQIYPLDGTVPPLPEPPPHYPRALLLRTEPEARASRAGANPLTVTPVGVADELGTGYCSVVVSEEDARRIAVANADSGFLDDWRVCFVLGAEVVRTEPADRAFGVSRQPLIRVDFSKPLNRDTLTSDMLALRGPGGETVALLPEPGESRSSCVFRPTTRLAASARYEVTLRRQVAGRTLRDACDEEVGGEGQNLATWSFTTDAVCYVDLEVTGDPIGAAVYLDDSRQPVGEIPCVAEALPLRQGAHMVRFEKPGYRTESVAVSVTEDGRLALPPVRLVAQPVALRADPEEAEAAVGQTVTVTLQAVDPEGHPVAADLTVTPVLQTGDAGLDPPGAIRLEAGQAEVRVTGRTSGPLEITFACRDDPMVESATFRARLSAAPSSPAPARALPSAFDVGERQDRWAPVELHQLPRRASPPDGGVRMKLGLAPLVAADWVGQLEVVSGDGRTRYTRVARLPAEFDYVVSEDGTLTFSPVAAGRSIKVSYRYRPMRVGVIYTGDALDARVTRQFDQALIPLQERGLELVAAEAASTAASRLGRALLVTKADALFVVALTTEGQEQVRILLSVYRPAGELLERWSPAQNGRPVQPLVPYQLPGSPEPLPPQALAAAVQSLLNPWLEHLGLEQPPSLIRPGERPAA